MTFNPQLTALFDKYGVKPQARDFMSRPLMNYIGGKFVPSKSDATLPVFEPSTGSVMAEVPKGDEQDVEDAVAAARAAFEGSWGQMKPDGRERILLTLADLIERDAEILGQIETIDNGKAIGPCIDFDILGSASLIRYMAGWATKIEGATRPVSAEGDHFAYTLKEPIGVVGAIVPWNWPLAMAVWKLAAPLAAGCTMVLKTSELTPFSMLYFMQLCEEAGLPAGALNIITGEGATVGAALARHPGVDKLSFTGSTPTGRSVAEAAASHFAPVTLELGGKSPMIAFEDADPEGLVEAARWSTFFNTGQNCSGATRLYAHKSIFNDVCDAIAKMASEMKIAPGLDPDCDIGPAISKRQQERVGMYLDLGKKEGADLVCGGNLVDGPGYFLEPTLFTTTDNKARIVQEEIFGPVLVALPFETEEEALAMANDSAYGLGASVWTRDISRAHRMVPRVQAGSVWVNCHDQGDNAIPFGGYKSSGYGKDLGPEQLALYLKTKAVWIEL